MPDTPRRVQLSRARGWRMPANTVRVDRSSRWGNPYRVAEHGRAVAVGAFREALFHGLLRFTVADVRTHLAGHHLACWCRPGEQCHADILLEVANP